MAVIIQNQAMKYRTQMKIHKVIVGLIVFFMSVIAAADQVRIAVASNFYEPMQEIARQFELESKHTVLVSAGSSGKLYAQIVHGAPFHIFFSADIAKPRSLIDESLANDDSLFSYAIGRLVLWSPMQGMDVESVLRNGAYEKLALANPRFAPYGQAAVDVFITLEEGDGIDQSRWVFGENIAQTWQFVNTGNTDLGFVALSQVRSGGSQTGSYWIVPQHMHTPIQQDAVVLAGYDQSIAVNDFLFFLKGQKGQAIINAYGYETENAF